MLIGITGTDGAGKGTVVTYLVKQKGFIHYSARAIWIEELKKRGQEPTRAHMRLIANEMRERYGNDFLITHYLERIAIEQPERAIIESIRAVAEAETLKKHGGVLIAIDADVRVRYERVQARRSETDRVSFDEFVAHEELEAHDPNPHGMQKQKVIAMADYTIMNSSSVHDLERSVDVVLGNILQK